jgi:PAS domain S-box-containing protein/putative nucleotidyltransferase with HDIG domain
LNKKRFLYSLPVILLLIVAVAGWFTTDYLGNKARQDIISESQASILTLSTYLSSTFTTIEGLVKSLAGSPFIAPALLSKRDQDIENANSALDRYNSSMNASVTYLMDANGMTVASSNRKDPDSFVGKSYRFRPYFQEAAKGQPYHYFALGITSKKRGFYASYPVQNQLGKVIGVVTMKKDIDDMAIFFRKYPFCFLINPDGIIFLSSKPEMVLKSFWPLDKTTQQKLITSQQFSNKPFGAVTQKGIVNGTEVTLEGKDYFVSRKVIDSGGWSIVLLTSTDRIWIYRLTGILATFFVCFLIMIFSGILYFTNRSNEAIRQSEEKYRTILVDIQEGYFEVDFAGNFTFFNDSLRRFLGYSKEELMGMNNLQYTDKEHSKKLFQAYNKVYTTGEPNNGFSWQITRKDGAKRYIEGSISLLKDSSGKQKGFRGIARDVTERKKAEEELKKEQLFNTAILDSVPGILYLYDETGHLVHWNKQNEEVTGYSSEELKGMHVLDWFGGVEPDTSNIINSIEAVMKNGHSMIEARIINKSGHAIPMILTGVKLAIDGKDHLLGIGIDITDRKKAEEALKNSEEKYRNIFEKAVEGIYQTTIEGRIITANAAIARMAGYDSPEELMESVKDIGTQLYVHPKDRKRFMEIREAKGFVDGFEVEFYKKDGSKFWVVINARTVKDEQGKILYIEGLIEDITIRKYAEEQLHQTLDSLRKSVDATIQVMVAAIEMRDPYTAGHQIRTADLARAIATEMGLPKDKIDGIRMAGSIHDIGKLSIPAEILSKPTKLTDIEFSLIKEHSRSGYEMLKDVESPWSLADIVYQHHERMDGSGYPRNLKGDEILIEARIMAVADVVEAMASHRPYRPGLGIDAALAEIERNKGTHYDNTVADACLRLFREKGYQLK